jgi:UDP-glucose 4-epimerase
VNAYDFGGRVAIVTGGASGIGAATVELLRTSGARVAVLDVDPEHFGVRKHLHRSYTHRFSPLLTIRSPASNPLQNGFIVGRTHLQNLTSSMRQSKCGLLQ